MQIQNALITGSFSYNGADLSNITSSNAYSASLSVRTTSLESTASSLVGASASFSERTSQVENTYASTGSNTFTGVQNFSNTCNPIGFNSVASVYTAGGLQVTYDSYFSSSVFVNGNLTVFGTQSVVHVSSSQFNIGTNIITVNTSTPSIRYGGLSVYDSGSTGLSGSIFWDSEANHWIYANASGSGGGSTYSGGMFISGPRSSGLGCEQGTTACRLLVGQGGDHLTSSMIYHDSTKTCFYTNVLFISSSGQFIFGNSPADFSFNVATTCVGTNATVAQFYNNDYTSGTRGFIRVRNGANSGATTSAYFGQGQDQKTYIYNNDPSRCGDIVINASGLVGINNESPGTQLDVKGMIRSTTGGLQVGKFGLASNPALSIGLDQPGFGSNSIINGWGNSSNGGVSVGTTRTDGFAFTVNTNVTMDANWQPSGAGTYAFVVNGNGNTGVGNCNPTAQLHVCSAYSQTPLVVQGGGNGNVPIACFMSGPNQLAIIDDNGNLIIGSSSFSTRGTTTSSGLLVCGRVGIGNPSPKENFTIGNIQSGNGGLAFCYMPVSSGVWSTFACVTDGDTNVVTDITFVNGNDFNRSGAFLGRWAYNGSCGALHIVNCAYNWGQNVNMDLRNSGGALQICLSGGYAVYKVQARTQGSRATG